jgi:hypothetical protein
VKSFEQARREEIRWRILRALDAGRPLPVAETLLFRVLSDVSLSLSAYELRRELDYLSKSKLVTLIQNSGDPWLVELTEQGIECVEYSIPCPPGIARPPQV